MTTGSSVDNPHDLHPGAILVFHHSCIREAQLQFGLVAFTASDTTPLSRDFFGQANPSSTPELNTLFNKVAGTLHALSWHGNNQSGDAQHHPLVLLGQTAQNQWHSLLESTLSSPPSRPDAVREWLIQSLDSGLVQCRDLIPTLAQMVCARRENHLHTREAFGARSPSPCGNPKYDAFLMARAFFEARQDRISCLSRAA